MQQLRQRVECAPQEGTIKPSAQWQGTVGLLMKIDAALRGPFWVGASQATKPTMTSPLNQRDHKCGCLARSGARHAHQILACHDQGNGPPLYGCWQAVALALDALQGHRTQTHGLCSRTAATESIPMAARVGVWMDQPSSGCHVR